MKCECGCEKETKIFRGKSNRFICGHNARGKPFLKKIKCVLPQPKKFCACGCGGKLSPPLRKDRPPIYINGHQMRCEHSRLKKLKVKICGCCNKEFSPRRNIQVFCSKKCWVKFSKTKPSPMKGRHHTKESIEKMRNAQKGKHSSEETKRRQSLSHIGSHRSEETKLKMSLAQMGIPKLSGEKHYLWRGGISFKPYCFKFNKRLKEFIRQRDNYICQLCDKTEIENHKKLSIHHIHYDKENCYPDLITLCIACNSIVNFDRDYWEEFFMKILEYRDLLN